MYDQAVPRSPDHTNNGRSEATWVLAKSVCLQSYMSSIVQGCEYEYIEQDLSNKSDLLLQCNPVYKKVPVLLHREKPISKPVVILEYIEETWPEYHLLPEDTYGRDLARFWIQFYVSHFSCIFRINCRRRWTKDNRISVGNAEILEEQGLGDKKFFGGDGTKLVDITHGWLALWFEAIEEMVGVKLLEPSTLPRLHAWVQNFKQVPVIRDNLPDYQKLVAHMKRVREMLVPQA
ncbi:hypothetical protein ACFX13_022826 [Malus domestica]